MVERQGPLGGQIGTGDALLEVLPSSGVLAQVEQGAPERGMGLEEVRWHGLTLRQPIELFPQLPCCWQRPPTVIELTEALQRREELGRVANLCAQRPRPGIGLLYLWGRIAFGGDERRPQGELQVEFLLDPCRGLGERSQQRQP